MQSINSISKKKRRLSQEQISIQYIPLKHHDSNGIQSVQKFKKVEHTKSHSRKSMELSKTSKCELNLDLKKRTTEWCKEQIDTIQFQQIIEKRKQKNRFKFKTIDIKSIHHRSNNSMVDSYEMERLKSVVDLQIKHEKKFSLQKESIEFYELERELKELNDKQVQEKTKNKVLGQLIAILSYEQSKPQKNDVQDRNLSLGEKQSKQIRHEQHKADFFIKLTNDIKEKINIWKKEIFVYRSQRVVYSSIFKELEREIKLAQNSYKRILINSMAFFESFFQNRLTPPIQRLSLQAQNSQNGLNSHNEYSNMFRADGVKFMGNLNFNEEELLHDRINSKTAINYYLKSRKVIILPRYKEHYQSSRKKIKIQSENLSYDQLSNQIIRFFQILNLNHSPQPTRSIESTLQYKKLQNTINHSNPYKNTHQNLNSPKKSMSKTNTHLETPNPNYAYNLVNFQTFAQSQIQTAKQLINQLPEQNQALFNQIDKIDFLIDQTLSQIQKQKLQITLRKTSPSFLTSNSSLPHSNQSEQDLLWQRQLETIQKLLGISDNEICEKRVISAIQTLEELQIETKTAGLFDKAQPTPADKRSPMQIRADQIDSDRSNVSIKFKENDPNLPSPEQTIQFTQKDFRKTQNDVLCRNPQNLNSILKNIQVYQSYERAFQRIDFEKEYLAEKNRKKRTLIRRDGMVSLCALKTQQKNKLAKRQSNKRQPQYHK